jgi:hypothetical protein
LREIKIRDYACGLLVTIVGLGLYSSYVRELMAALTAGQSDPPQHWVSPNLARAVGPAPLFAPLFIE